MDEIRKTLTASILKLLRPLVRLMLRNGFTYGDFADLSKWTFMDVASKEFGIPGRKQTVSRVSVITGLTRKEVSRLQKIDTPDDSAIAHQYNRAARVISGWLRDPRFQTKKGAPAALYFDKGDASFSVLVKEHSGDVPPRAIYDELVRVGTIAKDESGKITLLSDGYVPRTGETGKLHILGTDVQLLLNTIDHNLQQGSQTPYFQRKVSRQPPHGGAARLSQHECRKVPGAAGGVRQISVTTRSGREPGFRRYRTQACWHRHLLFRTGCNTG